MRSTHRVVVCVLAAVLVFTSCGDAKKTGKAGASPMAEAPSAVLDLVPEGAVGLVYVPNPKGLEDDLRRLVMEVDPKEADSVKIEETATMLPGIQAGDLDLSRGAAVAATINGFTAILPVKDEKAVAARAKTQGATVEASKGFVALTPTGAYKRGGVPAALAGPLPAGDIVARIDMATLGKTFGPMLLKKAESQIEELDSMGGTVAMTPAATLKPMLGELKRVLDASTVWDLAARIDGTAFECEIVMGFTDAAKTQLGVFSKSDLAALARAVPGDAPIMMALAMDGQQMWNACWNFMKGSLAVYPAADREAMTKMLEAMGKGMGNVGPGMAATGGFGPDGMEFVGVLESRSPAAYVKMMTDAMAVVGEVKGSMFKSVAAEERTVDGAKVHTWRIQIDTDKIAEMAKAGGRSAPDTAEMITAICGKSGMVSNAVDLGNRVLVVLGNDEVLKRGLAAAKSAASATPLSTAVSEAGSDVVGYMRMDVRALMRQMAAIAPASAKKDFASVPAGDPVIITGIANAEPGRFRARMSFDVGKMAKLFKSASGR